MSRSKEQPKYWREVWQKARRFSVRLSEKDWCNYWHQHFCWENEDAQNRFEHRRHIRPLMFAFTRAQQELAKQPIPYQVFVCINPTEPGSDALYVHTPNPHSAFPATFDNCRFIGTMPPLLMGLVDTKRYKIGVTESEGSKWYTIIPR